MPKKRDQRQRSGRRGEDAFELWAGDHRLLTSRPREDYGFDFVCEVESASTGTSDITGDFVAFSVKSTSSRANRVRLNRDDAERLLGAKIVACVALVEAGGGKYEVHHRFVDETFATELADFLASDRKFMTLTPAKCHGARAFDRNLEAALRGHFPERVRLAVARHRLAKDLPSPRLEVRRTEDGELTLVEVPDFYSFFVDSRLPTRGPHYEAIFGSPRLRFDRLADLGPRPTVVKQLELLPNPILVGGSAEHCFLGVAEGVYGRGVAPFTRVKTSTHTGWVHDGGFSITISARKREGDRWVHEIEALIDDDEALRLPDHPGLWDFLACCSEDAMIYPEEDPALRLGVEWINGIRRAHFFARYLREASKLDGWDALDVPLKSAKDDESLNTLAMAAEIATRPEIFQRFAFVVLRPGESHDGEVEASGQIPVIGNLGSSAVVLWVSANVTLLVVGDVVHGVRIDRVISARVEPHDRVDKGGAHPEMVVDPTWPTVAITGRGGEQGTSDARLWCIEMRLIDAGADPSVGASTVAEGLEC